MSFSSDTRSAIRNSFCNLATDYARAARFGAGLGRDISGLTPRSPQLPDGSISVPERLGNWGMGLFCDRPPFPEPVPAYTGGQCETDYSIEATTDRHVNGNLAQEGEINNLGYGVPGPIYSVKISPNSQKIRVTYRNMEFADFPSGTPAGGTVRSNLRDIVVTRRDSLPDNCGDPTPPPAVPLTPEERNPPIVINNNPTNIQFGLGNLNVNGNIVVPFTFDVGGLDLSGELNLNTGDISLNFGDNPANEDDDPIPTPDVPPPPADDDDDEGDAPANIIGAIVVATLRDGLRSTQVRQIDAPDIYAPKLAHISFKIKIGDSFHWTSDIPVKNKNNFIHNPTIIPAVRVEGTAEAGVDLTVIPVRGIVPGLAVTLI